MKGHVGVPVELPVEEYCTKSSYDSDGVQVSASIGKDGKEYGDPVPMAPPVGYNEPPDIMDMIRRLVRNERFLQSVEAEGFETFEEADDFELDEDPGDKLTEYEKIFEPPAPVVADGGKAAAAGGPQPTGATPDAVKVESKREEKNGTVLT